MPPRLWKGGRPCHDDFGPSCSSARWDDATAKYGRENACDPQPIRRRSDHTPNVTPRWYKYPSGKGGERFDQGSPNRAQVSHHDSNHSGRAPDSPNGSRFDGSPMRRDSSPMQQPLQKKRNFDFNSAYNETSHTPLRRTRFDDLVHELPQKLTKGPPIPKARRRARARRFSKKCYWPTGTETANGTVSKSAEHVYDDSGNSCQPHKKQKFHCGEKEDAGVLTPDDRFIGSRNAGGQSDEYTRHLRREPRQAVARCERRAAHRGRSADDPEVDEENLWEAAINRNEATPGCAVASEKTKTDGTPSSPRPIVSNRNLLSSVIVTGEYVRDEPKRHPHHSKNSSFVDRTDQERMGEVPLGNVEGREHGVLWSNGSFGNTRFMREREYDKSPDSIVCGTSPKYRPTEDWLNQSCATEKNLEKIRRKMTSDDWRQIRYTALMNGSNIDQLAYKLLQELVLSPITGLPIPALRSLSDALGAMVRMESGGHVSVRMEDLPSELTKALSALSLSRPQGTDPSSIFSDAMSKKTACDAIAGPNNTTAASDTIKEEYLNESLSTASRLVADNLLYVFEGGGAPPERHRKLGGGHRIPIRGRTPVTKPVSRSMRESGLTSKFDDNIELDPLYRWLLQSQLEKSGTW